MIILTNSGQWTGFPYIIKSFLSNSSSALLIDCVALGTLDYTCQAAPSPVQDKSTKSNASIVDRKPDNSQNSLFPFGSFINK